MRWLVLLLVLAGCAASPLGLLTGGGPNVAANVQAGQVNSQTIGTTKVIPQKIGKVTAQTVTQESSESDVRCETVERIEVQNGFPYWVAWPVLALLLLFWTAPTPAEMGRDLARGSRQLFGWMFRWNRRDQSQSR